METMEDLRKNEGVTVVSITHDLEEAARADRMIVLNGGEIFAEGTPDQVFLLGDKLVEIGLDLPFPIVLAHKLIEKGIEFPSIPTNKERLLDELCKLQSKS